MMPCSFNQVRWPSQSPVSVSRSIQLAGRVASALTVASLPICASSADNGLKMKTDNRAASCASMSFILFSAVFIGRERSTKDLPLHHPPGSRRGSPVPHAPGPGALHLKDALPGRHDPRGLRAAGLHGAARRAGAETPRAPDALSRGVRASQPLAGAGHDRTKRQPVTNHPRTTAPRTGKHSDEIRNTCTMLLLSMGLSLDFL